MSLTTVAEQTRAGIIVGTITLVLVVVGYFAWGVAKQILAELNPPPPPQPTYGFGTLPPIEFPKNNVKDFTYRLEMVSAQLPSLGGYFMPVYKITNERKSSGFFSLDRAKQQASKLGFILEPQLISGTQYRWVRNTPIYAQLDLDSVNNTFDLHVSWETDPSFLSERSTPTPEQATTEIKDLLTEAGFMPDDLADGVVVTKLLRYEGNEFVEAVSQSEAQFIEVNLFRKPLSIAEKSYEVFTPIPNKGIARGIVSSARTQGKRIIDLEYSYFSVDYETPESYPYITGAQAWELLQNGQGYVASEPSVGTEAVIRRVSAGYYDPQDAKQQYLQPIYVFYGDNDFVAFVPAIHPSVFQTNPTPTPN